MRLRVNQKIWALYHGDDYVWCGTIAEISKKTGISEETIRFYKTPTYKKKKRRFI